MIYGRFLVCSRSVVFPRKREREKERERERERRGHVRTTSNANNMWQLYFVSIARRRSALEPKLPAKSRSWRFDKHHQKRVLDLTFSFGTSSKPQRSNGRKKPAEKKIVISNVKKKEFHPLPKLLNACPDFFFAFRLLKLKIEAFFWVSWLGVEPCVGGSRTVLELLNYYPGVFFGSFPAALRVDQNGGVDCQLDGWTMAAPAAGTDNNLISETEKEETMTTSRNEKERERERGEGGSGIQVFVLIFVFQGKKILRFFFG